MNGNVVFGNTGSNASSNTGSNASSNTGSNYFTDNSVPQDSAESNLKVHDLIRIPEENIDNLNKDIFQFVTDYLVVTHDLAFYYVNPHRLFSVLFVCKYYADSRYEDDEDERETANTHFREYVQTTDQGGLPAVVEL